MTLQRGLDADLEEGIEDLEVAARRVAHDPEHIRLRGFFLIEEMLRLVNDRYWSFKTDTTPNLTLQFREKTWSELTRIKSELEKLGSEAQLELVDYTLLGHKPIMGITYVSIQAESDAGVRQSFSESSRMRTAETLKQMTEVVIKAIKAFRPYLRNEEALLGAVSESTAQFLRLVYGVSSAVPFNQIIRQLISLRM